MALRSRSPVRGCPWENGYAERLIRTLKEEEVDLNDYDDIHEVRVRIGHFITQGVSPETPAFGVRVFDACGIRETNLGLNLRNCGLNKRWHFTQHRRTAHISSNTISTHG